MCNMHQFFFFLPVFLTWVVFSYLMICVCVPQIKDNYVFFSLSFLRFTLLKIIITEFTFTQKNLFCFVFLCFHFFCFIFFLVKRIWTECEFFCFSASATVSLCAFLATFSSVCVFLVDDMKHPVNIYYFQSILSSSSFSIFWLKNYSCFGGWKNLFFSFHFLVFELKNWKSMTNPNHTHKHHRIIIK